jgi:hypothetical protein
MKVEIDNELSFECVELAKRIHKARTDIVNGKGIKLDVQKMKY